MNQLETFNQHLFLQINADAAAKPAAVQAATVVANDLIYLVPLVLAAMWLWGRRESRGSILKTVAVAALALGMGQIIGLIWPHPRPFMISVGHTLIPHTADPSFPSDHATVFSVVSLCLLLAGEIVPGVAMLLIGLCVAWARLYLGVHFPLDMVGAMAVALVGYLLVMPAWSRLGRSITDGAETLYRSMFRMAISRGWTLP